MSKIDCQKNLTGYDIARVRPDLEAADRPKTRGSMGICNLSYGQNQASCCHQRIGTTVHRGRSRVSFTTLNRRFVPAHSLCTCNDPDRFIFSLQNWPLLDMQFEI